MRIGLKIKLKILDNLIWVILGGLFLVNVFVTSYFFTYYNVINILYHSSAMGILVLAQGLCLMSGNFDLSIESTLAFAPAMAMLISTKWLPITLPAEVTIILTLAMGALIGLFNGYCVGKLKINAFLQTLSMLIILRGFVLYLVPRSMMGLSPVYTFVGAKRIIFNIPIAVLVLLGIFVFFHFILEKTRFGRFLLATGGNPRASFIAGINTDRVTIIVFMLSGLLASVAGLIVAGRQCAITNSMGTGYVFFSFAGAILGGVSLTGGIGSILGMLGGALLLSTVDNSLVFLGVNVFLIYGVKGILIFIAILLDNTKVSIRERLFHKEELRKFKSYEEKELKMRPEGGER